MAGVPAQRKADDLHFVLLTASPVIEAGCRLDLGLERVIVVDGLETLGRGRRRAAHRDQCQQSQARQGLQPGP